MYSEFVIVFFFFFQAEDGIRDGTVTGVQTCALPIFAASLRKRDGTGEGCAGDAGDESKAARRSCEAYCPRARERSEEHTSELQSQFHLVCRLLLEKKKNTRTIT